MSYGCGCATRYCWIVPKVTSTRDIRQSVHSSCNYMLPLAFTILFTWDEYKAGLLFVYGVLTGKSTIECHCGHIFAPTAIVNNMSSIVVGSRGSSSQCVSSKRQCVHPPGSISSCTIDQQPTFVGT
nr:hypothetical protein [Tanacetum cinerariifolium]